MNIFNPYSWPCIGDRLCLSRRRWGAYAGARLIARGHEPDAVLERARKGINDAAQSNRIGDMHEYMGIAQAAKRAKKNPKVVDAG